MQMIALRYMGKYPFQADAGMLCTLLCTPASHALTLRAIGGLSTASPAVSITHLMGIQSIIHVSRE